MKLDGAGMRPAESASTALMNVLLFIFGSFVLTGVGVLIIFSGLQSRDGYEDELGFHYGSDEPVRARRK
jgi:hypothetical protein